MVDNQKKFIQLSQELHNRCLEYMRRRGLGEKTKLYYKNELSSIFKNPVLTQTLYNKIYSKGGYYPSVLKLITNTCEHFDIPNYHYKIIKKLNKETPKRQVWHESDIITMINNVEDYGLLISCAYYIGAGLRFSSAIMLDWNDFVWNDWLLDRSKAGKCNITAKGGKRKVLVVDPILMNKLYSMAENSGKLFQGVPYKNSSENTYLFIKRSEIDDLEDKYKKRNFENIIDGDEDKVDVKKRAIVEIVRIYHYRVDYKLRKLSRLFNGIKPKFHSIRHSRATNLLRKGFKLTTIKGQLMHNSIATTEIYLNTENIDEENEFNEKL